MTHDGSSFLGSSELIRIRVENSFSTILDQLEYEQLQAVLLACSYFVKGAQFTPQFQSGAWDGRKKLFNSNTYRFPTGLVYTVKQALRDSVKIEDCRVKPQSRIKVEFEFPHELREYQEEVVKQALKAQRGILSSATGSGKTLMALKLVQELGVKTLFIVNTKEALYDTVRAAKACFPKETIGVYGDGKHTLGKFLTIAIMASVARCFKNKDKKFIQENYQCLIIDEYHHVGSDTWMQAVMSIDAFYKFGLTGTAFRNDGASIMLQAATGKLIGNIKAKDLQEQGFLAKSKIYFVNCPDPQELDRPLQYREIYRFGIVKNAVRNALIGKLVKKHLGKSILVVVEQIEHGEELFKQLKKIDKKTVFISGKSKQRKELKEAFERGDLRTVIASRIYNESADVPILEVVINASGGRSGIAVIQRVGRSLRLREGKEEAVIYDFYDSFNYKMEQHSMERMKWLKKEGHEVTVNYI